MSQLGKHVWQIDWPHGSAEVRARGAMLGPVRFRLANGQEFQPMHCVNWEGQSFNPAATGGFSGLWGEWPCVPFGRDAAPANLPGGWTARTIDEDSFFHGFSAHNDWQLQEAYPGFLSLVVEYPVSSPIAFLERQIQADTDRPSLTVTLHIHARQEVEIPAALHATFRVPEMPGSLLISSGNPGLLISYPYAPEPDMPSLQPDCRGHNLEAVKTIDGTLDLSCLPLSFAAEEVVQLVSCRDAIHLSYVRENALVILDWDRQLLPDALLWISNGGRTIPPWNGRHFALGVEPAAGPFDLGRVAAPPAGHPLANRLLKLNPERQTIIRYQLTTCSLL